MSDIDATPSGDKVPSCESCGRVARWRLADGSTWCSPCHDSALKQGYDEDAGNLIELTEVGT